MLLLTTTDDGPPGPTPGVFQVPCGFVDVSAGNDLVSLGHGLDIKVIEHHAFVDNHRLLVIDPAVGVIVLDEQLNWHHVIVVRTPYTAVLDKIA